MRVRIPSNLCEDTGLELKSQGQTCIEAGA
jgi:hypothetical protein